MSATIDFEGVNGAALAVLAALLARWLPDGKWHGAEYVARNPKRACQRRLNPDPL